MPITVDYVLGWLAHIRSEEEIPEERPVLENENFVHFPVGLVIGLLL
ncbi:MAG: hypothetical protein JOZ62_23610 [Acidobacteriaceae bacterium]|nr:hypothetical protein [Acidobacteriaceae bacterium]